jgi:hypothetical protein
MNHRFLIVFGGIALQGYKRQIPSALKEAGGLIFAFVA